MATHNENFRVLATSKITSNLHVVIPAIVRRKLGLTGEKDEALGWIEKDGDVIVRRAKRSVEIMK